MFHRKIKLFFLSVILCLVLHPLLWANPPNPLYVNLQDYPLYVKTGFDIADTLRPPDRDSGEWLVIEASPKRPPVYVKDLPLYGKPDRIFLSPFGAREMEFTFVIPFRISDEGAAAMERDHTLIPGIFLVSLGDNWEIYLNGRVVKAEMFLDGEGRIISHRSYRRISFPVEKNLFTRGENILAFRIVGDPTFSDMGFYYASPYYIDDYRVIVRSSNEAIDLILLGLYVFMGIHHLFMFLFRRKDRHNLYYGLFSLVLGIYLFTRTTTIYFLVQDSNIILRLELFMVILVLPLGAAFLESISLKKICLVTRIYGALYGILAISLWFFSLPYTIDVLTLWQYSIIGIAPFIIGHDIVYSFVLAVRDQKKRYTAAGKSYSPPGIIARTMVETSIGNLVIGAFLTFGTAVFDVIDSAFLHYGVTASRYGFFVFTAGSTLILARRFAFLFNQQQRIIIRSNKGMNTKLVDWIVIQDRDPNDMPSVNADNAIMFTDVRSFTTLSEGMSSRALTNFLGAINEVLAKPLFFAEDQGFVAYTDKFMGDGTMNIFTDSSVALRTAVEIRSQLKLFNADPRAFFGEAPADMQVNVGTGIAYGPVTLGIMGHSRRVDYTPIGDTVNLASRLENLTKEYNTPIIINDSLYKAVNPESFLLRHIDRIRVKGKKHPVDIYEEFSTDNPVVRDLKIKLLPRFTELQEMYFSGKNWDKANRLVEKLSRYYEESLGKNNVSPGISGDFLPGIYAKRMRLISENPELLAHWDGVYTFTSK
ncbi:MAG: adenylate/guanylate cyclase domain-containing protein [Treponema sp.]|jgi:class 3 adenylate cyclase|nr:adenylate/guanylate cyclase domain-containing protein [Treponema sp.]